MGRKYPELTIYANARQSPLTQEAINYAWRQLAQRAGVTDGDPNGNGFEALNISAYYSDPAELQDVPPGIVVVPCRDTAWEELLRRPPQSIEWRSHSDAIPKGSRLSFNDPIPILFWGAGYEDGQKPFVEQRADGSIVFYADILAAAFFMLSRWEETVVINRDEHERFPSWASVARRQGFLVRPVVDEWGLILRSWIQVLCPGWKPEYKLFTIGLSHDIDSTHRFPNLYRKIYWRITKLSQRYAIQTTLTNMLLQIIDIALVAGSRFQGSYLQGIYFLAQLSMKYGLHSAFYFKAADPDDNDSGYRVNFFTIKRCLRYLQKQKFELGFHAGYDTLNNPDKLLQEKRRLDVVLGYTQYGGRQHYLRFDVPNTWKHWEQARFSYDSTMGYADHEGFRCGTCHRYRPFDLELNRELKLLELPLIVMDSTLLSYRKIPMADIPALILALARRCKVVEGTFTFLAHNTLLDRQYGEWKQCYEYILRMLADDLNEF